MEAAGVRCILRIHMAEACCEVRYTSYGEVWCAASLLGYLHLSVQPSVGVVQTYEQLEMRIDTVYGKDSQAERRLSALLTLLLQLRPHRQQLD